MGLAIPRNRFVFPWGSKAEVNRDHPAYSPRLRYVGVPIGNSFINLVTGVKATIQGGSPALKMSPLTGQGVDFSATSSRLVTTGIQETPLRGVTIAAIVTPFSTSVSFGTIIASGNRTTGDFGLVMDSGIFQLFEAGGGHFILGEPSYAANRPYFVVLSKVTGTLIIAITDLTNGEVWVGSTMDLTSFTSASAATFIIGGQSSSGASQSLISALMFSNDGLSLWDLLAWAHDPWSFWYPRIVRKITGMSLQGPPPPAAKTSPAASLLIGI
jgi:hypothetical protein